MSLCKKNEHKKGQFPQYKTAHLDRKTDWPTYTMTSDNNNRSWSEKFWLKPSPLSPTIFLSKFLLFYIMYIKGKENMHPNF